MKQLFFVFYILVFPASSLAQQILDRPSKSLSPEIVVIDENEVPHKLNEFSKYPFILVPIYASCTSSCPLIIESLERDLPQSGLAVESYRVILFTFDQKDQAKDLKMLRQMHKIPPAWLIVRSIPEFTENLMSAIGVRSVLDPKTREFAHPDVLMVVGQGLKNSQRIAGREVSPKVLLDAVSGSGSESKADWKLIFSFLLPVGVVGTLICVIAAVHLAQKQKTNVSLPPKA